MTLKKSTYYALYAALEMARVGAGVQVTASSVAQSYGVSETVLAKVFQQLVRKGIAVGTRGTRGGYSLARRPAEVTVLEVIQAFEPSLETAQSAVTANSREGAEAPGLDRLRKLFDEVDELARCTYASVTLETLAGNRPGEEPRLHVVK